MKKKKIRASEQEGDYTKDGKYNPSGNSARHRTTTVGGITKFVYRDPRHYDENGYDLWPDT